MNMMVSEKIEFPPGVFFTPTDRQVIEFFLKPKVLGQDLLFDVVKNKQVYGPNANPWQVFDPNDHASWFDCPDKETEKIMLVFTKLSKIAATDSNKKKNKKGARTRENTSKKAGCGTWVAKTKPEQIKNCDGNVIGEKRYLVFDIKDTDSDAAVVGKSFGGSYRMHEYCLSGINERFDVARTLVLCKITYESSKNLIGPEIINHVLSSNSGKPSQKEERNNNILEETSTSTLTVMNPEGSTVGDDPAFVQDIINEFGQDICFDDQGGDFSVCEDLRFDEDWISEMLNSIPADDLVQDTTIANLGKRKFEAESLCGTKKLRLG